MDDIMPDPTVYTMAKVTELTHELSAAAACGEARICVIGLLDKLDPHFEKTHMGMLQSLALRQAARGTSCMPPSLHIKHYIVRTLCI